MDHFLLPFMQKIFTLGGCAMTLLILAGCASSQAAQSNVQVQNGNRGQMMRQNQQNLQQFLTDANAAPDKTELTKEQFTAEIQTLMQTQRANFPRNGTGAGMQRYGSGAMRSGTGSMMRRFGSGAGMRQGQYGQGGMQDRLAAATTFLKYTDSNDQEVLLAVDANGQVIMKWPMAFPGRGMRPQAPDQSDQQ